MKILVTGATGFVGGALVRRLVAHESPHLLRVDVALRRPERALPAGAAQHLVGDLSGDTNWQEAIEGVSIVVHCAARAHVVGPAGDSLAAFRAVNVDGTLHLARCAAAAGVKRFIFLSSIKVHGEATVAGSPLRHDDACHPKDAYGLSKLEAETGLRRLTQGTGMELVVIRPPLVYGPGVRANFAALMNWVRRGWPLPLAAVHNRRSLVGIDNLVDLIVTCLTHDAAPGQVLLVSDGEDVSTTQLLRRMGSAMGRPARLFPMPCTWLTLAAAMVGRSDIAQRLLGSLQVDDSRTRELLDWRPPLSLDEGLKRAAGVLA
ncbi:Cholesterol dehydrogenase [Variovorax sp. PBL-H6]|nr:Cholesterol dehydrogenase [Variovorax sp. PBL-H6]